jgi:hypothetical protein
LSTLVASTNVHKRNIQAMRGVASIGQEGSHKKPKLEARDYPLHQWKLFSPDEQKKIRQLRFKKKAAKNPRSSDKDRQAAAAGKGKDTLLPPINEEEPVPPDGSPPPLGPKGGQAGTQFGRAVHGKRGNNNQ